MKIALSVLAMLPIGAALAADPAVSAVFVTQDAASRAVEVKYTLSGAPAVVTVDFFTNTVSDASGDWVPIGVSNATHVVGDVFRIVEEGDHALYWSPEDVFRESDLGAVRAQVKAWPVTAPPDYMVVDLRSSELRAGAPKIRYYETAAQVRL